MTAPTLTQRVWAALARLDLDTKRALEWADCVERYGPDSGSAKGALLEIVREAWGDQCIHVCGDGQTWQPFNANMDVLTRGCFDTEIKALVAALEAAPDQVLG